MFKTVRIQIAYFLAAIDLSSKIKIAASVSEIANGNLNVDPLLLPFTADIPPEFPLIIIKNASNGWSFQLAPGRFDLTIEKPYNFQSYQKSAEDIQKVSINILDGLKSNYGARSNRIGSVSTFSFEVDGVLDVFKEKYLKTEDTLGAEEIRLQYLHKLEIESLNINKWVRLAALSENDPNPSRLILEVDINTRAESPININHNVPVKFFNIANRLVGDTIYGHSG